MDTTLALIERVSIANGIHSEFGLARPSREELERIEREVQRQLSLRVHQLRVHANDRGLVLSGRTRTYYGKQLAQQAVGEFSRVPISANNIVVG